MVWIRYIILVNALVMQQEYGITTVSFCNAGLIPYYIIHSIPFFRTVRTVLHSF
jgi:hypothetical protein